MDSATWPQGIRAAISLCYDGTTREHLEHALLAVEMGGLHATFYAAPSALIESYREWAEVAGRGHEIGNGALIELADEDGLLPPMDPEGLRDEMEALSQLLQPVGKHSLAYPAVRTVFENSQMPVVAEVVRSSIIRLNEEAVDKAAQEMYRWIRTPHDGLNMAASLDLARLRSFSVDGLTGERLCEVAGHAIRSRGWAIFVFSGLRSSQFDAEANRILCDWLSEQPDEVLVGPVVDVAERLLPSLTGASGGAESGR
jgi:peptidoglycan/xylan/chitin deacetylase (PgdA/CDA1 family)